MPSKESLLTHNKLLLEFIRKNMETSVIFLEGGELFHRPDIKEVYEGFDATIETIRKINLVNRKVSTTVFSNLLYENLDLIKYFIVKSKFLRNITIKTSFDLDGRFKSNKQIDLFLKNLDEVENYTCIQFRIKSVITKQTLKNFDENSYVWKVFRELVSKNSIEIENFKPHDLDDIEYEKKFFIDNTEYKNNNLVLILNALNNFNNTDKSRHMLCTISEYAEKLSQEKFERSSYTICGDAIKLSTAYSPVLICYSCKSKKECTLPKNFMLETECDSYVSEGK